MESCWHCNRDVHEAPLTERVAKMYDRHSFDLEYSAKEDDSPIICLGSGAIGPARPRTWSNSTWKTVGYAMADLAAIQGASYVSGAYLSQFASSPEKIGVAEWSVKTQGSSIIYEFTVQPVVQWHVSVWDEAWKLLGATPEEPKKCELPDDVPEIEFGPKNWVKPESYPVPYPMALPTAGWEEEIPLPELPKTDYKELGEKLSKKLTWSFK
ncbi:hypothetical protein SEA_ERICMILLARD_144 [Mycobacterium phage EricMillard]|uniref:Uncharacterized protein n=2 Tax=Omegavirus baka TaxID=1034099 RepID=A0A3S9UB15_9CAUD|nr:hypothetical protein FGG20_gp152 [Mycobacterium phage Baka]AEK08208.1 hypothetical protein PBI_BAKA_152 [Mycobacterium phage Baka]ATN89862.1 hypothetical protein SEA_KLEIN_149 [Mycobacterium phage Klein]AXQ52375.1 hypothetical protein SEA_ERICMILLARD_144 [Mycobacterium phage EricMillard]AZS07485.1 hypothetical protein PBI_DUKE13_148 [Mycobacterium phage Duke13]